MSNLSPEDRMLQAGATLQVVNASVADAPNSGEAENWRDLLMRNDDGKVISNHANVLTFLRHAPDLTGCFARDEMMRATMLMKPLFRRNAEHIVRAVHDNDVSQAREWLQRHGMPRIGGTDVNDAVNQHAHEKAFHPVRDYLSGLKWDGSKRLEKWLTAYAGATDDAYTREVGKMFLIAMVARIRQPGCKCDYTIVLEGPQGARKSTICKILGGGWFSDAMPDIAGSDAVRMSMHLRGKWLIELAELSSISKGDVEKLKSFLTQSDEVFTPKYARNEVREPRQCVFIGTTNQDAYIQDATGGRRFWPVKVGTIDTDALARDRDQLFAEAVVAYERGDRWYPQGDFEVQHIAPQQAARAVGDEWTSTISEWLAKQHDQTGRPIAKVTVGEIAEHVLHIEIAKLTRLDQARISDALTTLKWTRKPSNGKRWFVRPKNATH